MQPESLKQRLASRLMDKGVNSMMPGLKQAQDRPMTAKIALKGLNTTNLPPIQDVSEIRGSSQKQRLNKSLNNRDLNDTMKRTSFIGNTTTNDIVIDERRLAKSKQIQELMDKMIGKSKQEPPPSPPKVVKKPVQLQQIPQPIMEATRRRTAIRTASQKGKRQILTMYSSSDESDEDQEGVFKLRDVDTFIQMIKEQRLSQMEFMYLVKNKQNSNDPYNMKAVSYHHIEKHRLSNYYTLSAKGLTRYENHISIEFVHLGDWLTEREQFNSIKSLSFFRKFRMWKTMKKWIRILSQSKTQQIQAELCEKMLLLKPNFQHLILNHRSLCFEMESLRVIDIPDDCRTLEQFTTSQEEQRASLSEKLRTQSEKMRENCRQSLRAVIEKLRTQINQEISSKDDHKQKTVTTNKVDLKKQILESFGFPEGMEYGHRALMRSEFVKFLRLAYLLDFMAVQSLGQIYIKSCIEFLDKFIMVQEGGGYGRKIPLPGQPEDKKNAEQQPYDPLFVMHFTKINQDEFEIVEEQVELSSEIDFDLQPNLIMTPTEMEFSSKRVVLNLASQWIEVQPSQRDFMAEIQRTFSNGLEAIQVVERWSKHTEFLPYIQALEEWDEIIGERWTKPDSKYLNPSYWVKEHPLHYSFMHIIGDQLDHAYKKVKQFESEIGDYLNLVWRQENSDTMELANPALQFQSRIFTMALKSAFLVQELLRGLSINIDIGLFRVRIENLMKSLLGSQAKQLISLEELYLQLFRKRSLALKQQLQVSIKSLSGMVIRIEEFIEQKNSVDRITKQMPQLREEIETTVSILNLMVESSLQSVKKEDRDIAQDLNYLESSLNVALSEADNNTAKNIERFKKTLKDRIDKLKQETIEVAEAVQREKYLLLQTPITDAIAELSDTDEKVKVLEATAIKYSEYEEILGVQEQAQYELLENSREQLNLRLQMWTSIRDFRQLSAEWVELPFGQINAKEVAQKTEQFVRTVQRCEKNLADNKVIQYLKRLVWEFKDTIPVVSALRSQYLLPSHWIEIKSLVRQEFDVSDVNFTLNKLLDLNVAVHVEAIQEISVKAAQEDALGCQLKAVEQQWVEIELKLKPYKDTVDTMVLGEVEELIQLFDEGLANMSNILASRYVRPLRQKAEKMQSDLLNLSDIIDKWVECQKKWMYLESIFASPDIKKQLSAEAQQFDGCDKMIRKLVKTVNMKPQILKLLTIPILLDNLNKTSETLDLIEKSLEDYLEVKRTFFPRFYFLSNEELLEILAQQTNVEAIQQHLQKCFEALVRVTVNESIIIGIESPEGETISYNKSISARGNVEIWLKQVEIEMIETLRKLTKSGLQDYANGVQKTRNDWILAHKSQIACTVSQIMWSINTEDAINESQVKMTALEEWYEQMNGQLNQLTLLVRGDLTSIQRKTIVALITTDVHNRDIVAKLTEAEVESTSDFLWQQQLRYYWDDEADDCLVRQVSSVFHYGYEYLGATSRLVITPLTDRCWITITSALSNQLGAAPAGPAGTGKTESTKDLAKALGRYCIVFNCSDQITAAMMNKLFSGLVQQGAWTCLDEFNRIDIEVLSVIAQQLLQIRLALLQKSDEFSFDGRIISMKSTFGVFITMNPGYAGRTELPDNLKTLFRPVAMMIPEYRLIAQIMLYAEGFEKADELSSKMVQLYKLSSQQLSQQDHYDFGMRAVKSLLVMAGSLKRADVSLDEEIVLIRAMRDANIPKFLKDDLPLFEALIADLFPSIKLPNVKNELLESELQHYCQGLNLEPTQAFITKTVQLHDTVNVRFGSMIVGGSGAGKTQCYQLLAQTLTESKHWPLQIKYYILNPKSINMGELYGEVDPFTNEWQDGLASSLIRECNQNKDSNHWIIFDGPVDALWIENMNSVLDDSMTLCLANSERIKLRSELRMLFEVQDLSVASPATVSRCGMVYMTVEDMPWLSYCESWIQQTFYNKEISPNVCCHQLRPRKILRLEIPQVNVDQIRQLFRVQFQFLMDKMSSEPFATIPIQRARNVCDLLGNLLSKLPSKDELPKKITHIFAWACLWGLCISFEPNERMETHFKDAFPSILYPKVDSLFDIYLDDQYSFVTWESQLQEYQFEKDQPYFSLMVPTVDTLKFTHAIKLLIQAQKPILLVGQTGTGKSVLTQTLLRDLKEQAVQSVLLNFSAQTKARESQMAIEGKLHKKGKTLFGARANEQIAIFIDDVNMPALEQYGASPCIELLRLLLELDGVYDRVKLFWKHVEDTVIITAAGPAGGGRNPLSQRFLRQMHILNMPVQSDVIYLHIYGQILKGYLHSLNFNDGVRKQSETITRMTIDLFRRISAELLPIPAKFHYTFNSRDISKVFQGLLQVRPISVNPESVIRLWQHECARVFCDRLTGIEDKSWFDKVTKELIARYTSNRDEGSSLWSDVLKLESATILYEEVTEKRQVIQSALQERLQDYVQTTNDKVDLVFFDDALEHVLRISRILRQPRGNAMLIGVGGSGKQSLAKLSSFLMRCEILQLEIVKTYNQESFRADLQRIAMKTGGDRKQLCFIFTEAQIVQETFLEDINNLLNSGEVPNLFQKKEEIELISQTLRPLLAKLKKPDSPESLWNFFIEGIRDNLHIVLCMSPVGDLLRLRSRKFPSLINCCTLNWFAPWPQQALLQVANTLLQDIPFQEQISQLCTEVQLSVQKLCDKFYRELRRQVYITPKSYLDQIKLYSRLYELRRKESTAQQKKLADGLDKLFKANQTVAVLQIEMQEIQPQLVEQQTKTEQFLRQLAIDQGEANIRERAVNEETQLVNQQAFEIKLIADEAQGELNKALPIMREAEEALSKINKNDIAEVKGFISPPAIVILVLEAVCILLGEKTDWNSAKQVLVGNDFMERLVKYDKNAIQDSTLRKLRMLTNRPDFEPIFVGQKSQACKSLCMWCRAIDNYSKIAKEVEPKRKKVADMQSKLEVKNQELAIKQAELQKIRERVGKLQHECDETMERKNHLEKELERTKKRLIAAEKLTFLLADEGVRWKEQILSLDRQIADLSGDVFIAASTVSYLAAFTGPYRDTIIQEWITRINELQIPMSDYSLANTLESPITIKDWLGEGLPNDAISIDNAIIVMKCDRWPLMIDPQGQANKWLKAHNRELKVLRFTETHFLKALAVAITSGFEVLFEEITHLEPSIDSVLQKSIIETDGRKLIRVGDQRVDCNHLFRLFLTTKVANPSYLPEVFIKVTVVNFAITFEGLQDQLLGEVMKYEKAEIEKQREEVIVKMSNANKSLKQAQDSILDLLANAEGMILDNEALINTLELSKQQSIDIERSLRETSIIEAQINESRNLYVSVAVRGSVLYFVIQDMSGIDPMYQYSLLYFRRLFLIALQESPKSDILQERLTNLENTCTQLIYSDVSRGLFEQHKRIFSFLICTSIHRQSHFITPLAWTLLLRELPPKTQAPNPDKILFKDSQWNLILAIQSLPELSDLASDLKNNLINWREFASSEDLYNTPYPIQSPLSTSNNMPPFLKLLIIKALKPEKLINASASYVSDQLGQQYTEVVSWQMDEVYKTSTAQSPIIFILSPGADPTSVLFKLSKDLNTPLGVMSLGQGQGKKAELMISKAQKDGSWVLLQNCHLARSWMPSLEAITEQFVDVNPNFRLFLTSMPAPYFPVSTLQNGLKLTTEPPRGLKANLRRSHQEMESQNTRQRQLQFSLAFFHAVVQERRKFGAIGFNKAYEFNDSDIQISAQMLKAFSNEEDMPWDAILFMIGQINYGGRVTDDQDRICLLAILRKYLGDHLEERVKFSDSGIYYLPNDGDNASYAQYIEKLPPHEDPEVFGMHENANIVFQTQESQKMLDVILSIQPRVAQTDGPSPDQLVQTKIQQLQDLLPEQLDKNTLHQRHLSKENESIPSLSTVLLQEIDKFNVLLQLIKYTLQQLQLAIQGFVVMSSDLDQTYLAFMNNQLPALWQKKSYATLKPLSSWFKDLTVRVNTVKSWMEKESTPSHWMSGLFYPQGFLTGVLQTHSRKYKIPIDELSFKFRVLDVDVDRIKDEPKDGVYVHGLYLDGAKWDGPHDTLVDQSLGQLYYPIGILHFQPIQNYKSPEDYYSCPCYKTSNRIGVLSTTGQSTNFILSIDLPSKTERPEFWTLRGTAIISQLND